MQRYLTDRKRADGLGSGRHGTHHHWHMMMTSLALVVVVPVFLVTFLAGFGGTYAEVVAYFSQPIPAIIVALSLIVTISHVTSEAVVAVEDYVHGARCKLLIIGLNWFSYILIAVGLFAIARMAL